MCFLCEAMVYTMRGDHCRCSKPGDTRAMYNETPAVRTAVTLSKSKHWRNNNNTSVHFKERKQHWNTLYQYWIFFKQYKEEEDSFVVLTYHCEVNMYFIALCKSCFHSATHGTTRLIFFCLGKKKKKIQSWIHGTKEVHQLLRNQNRKRHHSLQSLSPGSSETNETPG